MSTRTTSRQTLRGGAFIAVAMGVMNVTTYAFTILAARLLGPSEYGALAAVMGLLMVVNVLSLGLQATGARRVSAAPGDRLAIEREVMATSYGSALTLGLLVLVASPVVAETLNLDSWAAPALIAVTAVPLTVMGGQAGILQGERRWGPLAAIYFCVGVGRLAFGGLTLFLDPDTVGAMLGVAAGAFVPAVLGWSALRHPDRQADGEEACEGTARSRGQAGGQTGRRDTARVPARRQRGLRWTAGGVLHETLHNSHALLAFFALSNVDVVVARITLSEHQAGLYAGGLILAKAVLFLPQFVVVIAFPAMSRNESGRRMHLLGLALVLAIGGATVLLTAVLSPLAVVFIGGSEYAGLQGRLWVFAVLGTLLAMIQLLVYNVVARQHRRMVFVVWAALLAVLCSTPFLDSLTGLLAVVVGADTALFVVLLLTGQRDARGVPEGGREGT